MKKENFFTKKIKALKASLEPAADANIENVDDSEIGSENEEEEQVDENLAEQPTTDGHTTPEEEEEEEEMEASTDIEADCEIDAEQEEAAEASVKTSQAKAVKMISLAEAEHTQLIADAANWNANQNELQQLRDWYAQSTGKSSVAAGDQANETQQTKKVSRATAAAIELYNARNKKRKNSRPS